MREAVGQSFIYNFVIVFLFVALLILICSLSYSKSFKAKNKIISIIEDHKGYNSEVEQEIDTMLRSSGYRSKNVFKHNTQADCPGEDKVPGGTLVGGMANYPYCIYSHNEGSSQGKGVYYTVVIYMRFEIPILSGIVELSVHGDTKTIYKINEGP